MPDRYQLVLAAVAGGVLALVGLACYAELRHRGRTETIRLAYGEDAWITGRPVEVRP